MTHIRGSEGAGQTGYRLIIRNAGKAPCYFGNEPSLTLLSRRGRALPTHVHWIGKFENIAIAPGKAAVARLRFSPDIAGPGESQKGRCEPVARRVRVELSLHLKTLGHANVLTGPVRPPTSVCEHGRISASVLG